MIWAGSWTACFPCRLEKPSEAKWRSERTAAPSSQEEERKQLGATESKGARDERVAMMWLLWWKQSSCTWIYIYAYIYNILLVGCQPTIIIGGHAAFLSVAAVAGWLGERRGHGLISIVECSYSSSIGCETSLFEAYPLYEFVDFWRLFLLQHIPTWA